MKKNKKYHSKQAYLPLISYVDILLKVANPSLCEYSLYKLKILFYISIK